MNKYYTFQVITHFKDDQGNVIAHLFKDCTEQQITGLRKDVWTIGVRVQKSPVCWEIISPFSIKSVFITLQDKKYIPE